MRVVFMGTPEFAVPTLRALVEAGHEVIAAYTQPPRPAGRGKRDRKSAVQLVAEELGIAVRHPASLKGADAQAEFAALNADIAVVAAYGLILPQAVLDAPRFGCLNVHASLLPRWRGAAPIQRAILAGDEVTGVTIMRMEAGLDTGPMLATAATPLGDYDTGDSLTVRLSQLGAELIARVLADISDHPEKPQPLEGVTYAKKVEKSEARLDFTQSSRQVHRQVRAFNPSPGAFFEIGGERIRVHTAAILGESPTSYSTQFHSTPGLVLDEQLAVGCSSGAIRLTSVQRAGRGFMDTLEFLRGFPIPAGSQLD